MQIGMGRCVADPVETLMCYHVNGYNEGLAGSVHSATSADATEQSCRDYDSPGMPLDCLHESQTTH